MSQKVGEKSQVLPTFLYTMADGSAPNGPMCALFLLVVRKVYVQNLSKFYQNPMKYEHSGQPGANSFAELCTIPDQKLNVLRIECKMANVGLGTPRRLRCQQNHSVRCHRRRLSTEQIPRKSTTLLRFTALTVLCIGAHLCACHAPSRPTRTSSDGVALGAGSRAPPPISDF